MKTKPLLKTQSFRFLSAILGLIFFLNQCCPGEPILIECETFNEKELAVVPYVDGEVYSFEHSGGQVINFTVTRSTKEEIESCSECCKYIMQYYTNTTVLTPDYPIFEMKFYLMKSDEYMDGNISIGNQSGLLPLEGANYASVDQLDSIVINSETYTDIFSIKMSKFSGGDIDEVIYDYENGILKVIMSNYEFYEMVK